MTNAPASIFTFSYFHIFKLKKGSRDDCLSFQ